MAGEVDNETLLAALNQSVQAINDLATALSAIELAPSVTVNPTCTPQVVVNCTCGGGSGSDVPSSNGDEGQTPPAGYTEPDSGTTDRKCKVANIIHDDMQALVTKLAIMDADQWAGVGYIVALAAVGSAIGSVVPAAGTLVGGVAGVVVGIATQLVTGGVLLDLSDLATILSENQETLVNGLYNATSADDARASYTGTLTGQGCTVVETAIISLALTNDLLNLLFFTKPGTEEEIDAYTGTINCTDQQVLVWHFDNGAEGWVLSYDYGSEYQVGAGWYDGAPGPDPNDTSDGLLRVMIEKTSNLPGCEPKWKRDVSAMGIVAHEGDTFSFDAWYTTSDHSGGNIAIVYEDDESDSEYYPNFSGATWTPLSVTVSAGNDGKTIKRFEIGLGTGEQTGNWTYAFDYARLVQA